MRHNHLHTLSTAGVTVSIALLAIIGAGCSKKDSAASCPAGMIRTESGFCVKPSDGDQYDLNDHDADALDVEDVELLEDTPDSVADETPWEDSESFDDVSDVADHAEDATEEEFADNGCTPDGSQMFHCNDDDTGIVVCDSCHLNCSFLRSCDQGCLEVVYSQGRATCKSAVDGDISDPECAEQCQTTGACAVEGTLCQGAVLWTYTTTQDGCGCYGCIADSETCQYGCVAASGLVPAQCSGQPPDGDTVDLDEADKDDADSGSCTCSCPAAAPCATEMCAVKKLCDGCHCYDAPVDGDTDAADAADEDQAGCQNTSQCPTGYYCALVDENSGYCTRDCIIDADCMDAAKYCNSRGQCVLKAK